MVDDFSEFTDKDLEFIKFKFERLEVFGSEEKRVDSIIIKIDMMLDEE